MKYLVCLITLASSLVLQAQNRSVSIKFNPVFNNELLLLNKSYIYKNDSIRFENVKFYISDLQFFNNNNSLVATSKKYYLFDLENPTELVATFDETTTYNTIVFKIGIDSITNVSGAFGDDLDPTNGMYWTWQSGYINFKLEGTSTLCPARNNFFQFHIGGYQQPYNTLQTITLNIEPANELVINVNIEKLLEQINLNETYEIMSPNQKAFNFAKLLPSVFEISK